MTEQSASPSSVGLRYGLITGFILIVFNLILYLADLSENRAVSWLGWIIVIAGLVLAMKSFKQENNGFMSYGQGLGIGSILGVVAGILAGAFAAIYTTYIDNTVIQRAMDKQIEQMESRGIPQEQIDKSMEYANMFSGPIFIIIVSILLYALGAFLLSLIISAIMKRSQPEFE